MLDIIDGHVDTVYAIRSQNRIFSERSVRGHVDLPRCREGQISAIFMAVYPAMSDYYIRKGVDEWFSLVEDPKNELYHVKSFSDLEKAKKENKIGAILHFEGSGGLDSEFHDLHNYFRLGLRSMGITWSNANRFGTGISLSDIITIDEERGLTAEGRALVEEMQKLGIIVDVSHLNDKSFWDVQSIASQPFIASHSNSRAICSNKRNLTDEQIVAIKDAKGTIGINLSIHFLDPERRKEDHITFDIIKSHIDHIVEIGDINTVCLGSDFDGTTIPSVLKDISYYPKLVEYLSNNGYTDDELKKITSENFKRVMKSVWK